MKSGRTKVFRSLYFATNLMQNHDSKHWRTYRFSYFSPLSQTMRFRSAVQFAAICFGTVLALNILPLLANKSLVGPHASSEWSLFRLWQFVNLPGFLFAFPFLDLLAHKDDSVHDWNNWAIVMASSVAWGASLFIILLLFVDDLHIRVKRLLKREYRDDDRKG